MVRWWPCVCLLGLLGSASAVESDFKGQVDTELRLFSHAGTSRQHSLYPSLALQGEWYRAWGDDSLTFTPFYRWDARDGERTHFDIRELSYVHVGEGWELEAGIGKVFWGVTEVAHLVDIVNQTDLVENIDGEQKLGQPLLRLSFENDWGTVDLFAMTGFREHTYPGAGGRLGAGLRVATERARFVDGRDTWSPDFAVRWSHYVGDWDIGLSHFHGTAREPRLQPGLDGFGRPVLIPLYGRIDQTGLDLQATRGDWLWKLELIRRSGQGGRFIAADFGFEYTRVGVADTAADLGWLVEVLYDDRGDAASTPFNHDLFLGLRWTANDEPGSELLAGVVRDWHTGGGLLSVEASRRLGNASKLAVQARAWFATGSDPLLFPLRDEDYLEVRLSRYF
ncbi:hypothetical protein [endosymbiont of unidentified scaly snail isolate Monju]|uniref:hypothetical protein n=1 Tax=endosymbiont of unidentified scaly snail isolate Monju TaxID=1248727 RepID=UPI0003892DD3|nr:hypothetical protein [endosymbiont of unidentified scaly snail isolate Monju]BAN69023.1 conserved hypothetical protein [endosymbiont of unidentified scaly snail isolate Monju]